MIATRPAVSVTVDVPRRSFTDRLFRWPCLFFEQTDQPAKRELVGLMPVRHRFKGASVWPVLVQQVRAWSIHETNQATEGSGHPSAFPASWIDHKWNSPTGRVTRFVDFRTALRPWINPA